MLDDDEERVCVSVSNLPEDHVKVREEEKKTFEGNSLPLQAIGVPFCLSPPPGQNLPLSEPLGPS